MHTTKKLPQIKDLLIEVPETKPVEVLYTYTKSVVYKDLNDSKRLLTREDIWNLNKEEKNEYVRRAYLDLQHHAYSNTTSTTISKMLEVFADGKFIALGNYYYKYKKKKVYHTESQILTLDIDDNDTTFNISNFKHLPINGIGTTPSYNGNNTRIRLFIVLERPVNSTEYQQISAVYSYLLENEFGILKFDTSANKLNNIIRCSRYAYTYTISDTLMVDADALLDLYTSIPTPIIANYLPDTVDLSDYKVGKLPSFLKSTLFMSKDLLNFANHVGFIPTKYQLANGVSPNRHGYSKKEWYDIIYCASLLYHKKVIDHSTFKTIILTITGNEMYNDNLLKSVSKPYDRSLLEVYELFTSLGYKTSYVGVDELLNQLYCKQDNSYVLEYDKYLGNTDLSKLILSHIDEKTFLLLSNMGSGKTHLVLDTLSAKLDNCNILLTLPTIDVANAVYDKYKDKYDNMITIVSSTTAQEFHSLNITNKIIVTSVDKLQFLLTENDYVIVDEVHNILVDNNFRDTIASNIYNAVNGRKKRLITLTGTPHYILPLFKFDITINCVRHNIVQPFDSLDVVHTTNKDNKLTSVNLLKSELSIRDLVVYFGNNKNHLYGILEELVKYKSVLKEEVLVVTSVDKTNFSVTDLTKYKLILTTSVISSGISIDNTPNSSIIVSNTLDVLSDAIASSQAYHRFRNPYDKAYLLMDMTLQSDKYFKCNLEKSLSYMERRIKNLDIDEDNLGVVEKALFVINKDGNAVLDRLGHLTEAKKNNDNYYLYNVGEYLQLLINCLPNANINITDLGTSVINDTDLPNNKGAKPNKIRKISEILVDEDTYMDYVEDKLNLADYTAEFLQFISHLPFKKQQELSKILDTKADYKKFMNAINSLNENVTNGRLTLKVKHALIDSLMELGDTISYKSITIHGVKYTKEDIDLLLQDVIEHVTKIHAIGKQKAVLTCINDFAVKHYFVSGGKYHTFYMFCSTVDEVELVTGVPEYLIEYFIK